MSPSREKLSILLINLNFSSNWLKSSHPSLLSCSPTFYAVGWEQFYLKCSVFLREPMCYEFQKQNKVKSQQPPRSKLGHEMWKKISSSFQVNHFKNFCVYLRREERICLFPQGTTGLCGCAQEQGLAEVRAEQWEIGRDADLPMTNRFCLLQYKRWKPLALLMYHESRKTSLEGLDGILLDLFWGTGWSFTPAHLES